MVFSARFAVLACLCAALPLALPPPVEAAHIYGSHTVEKHASSSHAQQRTRTRDSSLLGRPTATHRHDGKNNGDWAPDRRASGLPPLLRRDRVHNHNKIHNQHGQGSHGDAHHKVPRSAFARSRYRREPAYLGRRSSVYVPGEHGDTYLVSRTPPRNWGHGKTGQDKQLSHAYDRRQVDESNLVLGRIDIMGAAQSLGSTQRLASLRADSNPVDWTSGQSSAKAFTLNASTTNQTQFIMMPTDETSNATGSSKHVALATEVFDANSAEMVMYCATYDSDPGATSVLLMTPCTGTAQSAAPADDTADPCAEDGNDASSSSSHESQIFSYDPSSGQIEPISVTASSSGTGDNDSSDDLASCAGARVRRDTGNSTTSGSVRPSTTSTSTAPTASASQQARNVTLVFVASALEVLASSPSSSNTTTTGMSQASALTKTITTTVVVPVTASGSSTSTVTPVQAAVSVPSQSTTVTAPSAFTTATAARSSLSLSSSVSPKTTSSAPADADESLEVEIVGVASTTTASSSSTFTTTTTTTTTTATTATSSHSSSSVSKSLDPLAVASSIANAMMSRRAPAFVSASITR